MRRDLFDLVAYGMKRGLRVSVSPSVTKLVTRDVLTRLHGLGISRLSFSLDGANAELHDSFRGMGGSFDTTLARMQDALDAGLSLQVNTTVSRHNLEDLPRIAELLSTFPRLVLWDVFFLVPTGRGQRDDVISPEDHERVYEWIYDLGPSVPFAIKTTLGQHYRRLVIQRALREGKDLSEVWSRVARTATNDGKGVCFISHIGEVHPSGFLPIPCGNVRKQSVVEIYRTSPVFQALRDPDNLKGKCGRCHFKTICGGCRARAYGYSGDYLGSEPCCVFDADAPERATVEGP